MNLLCDTCSIIMLLRIVPDLFQDSRFECVTISEVRRELTQTQKFKTRYPWLKEYSKRVVVMPQDKWQTKEYKEALSIVRMLNQSGRNTRNGKMFGLSKVDMKIAAAVIPLDFRITTVERPLQDFLKQQFNIDCEQPLKLINDWLEKGLLKWTNDHQGVINDWIKQNERDQPRNEIRRFEHLSGRKYPRSSYRKR